MSTREAIEALIGGKAYEFREKIEKELADRSMEAIQTKRFEVGASMFDNDTVEEELSPDAKQKRYKDIKSAAEKSKKNTGLIKKAAQAEKRAKKDVASDPDMNEEVEQLDELSPKTLNSYADKASPDIRKKSLDPKKREKRALNVAKARFKALKPKLNTGSKPSPYQAAKRPTA